MVWVLASYSNSLVPLLTNQTFVWPVGPHTPCSIFHGVLNCSLGTSLSAEASPSPPEVSPNSGWTTQTLDPLTLSWLSLARTSGTWPWWWPSYPRGGSRSDTSSSLGVTTSDKTCRFTSRGAQVSWRRKMSPEEASKDWFHQKNNLGSGKRPIRSNIQERNDANSKWSSFLKKYTSAYELKQRNADLWAMFIILIFFSRTYLSF